MHPHTTTYKLRQNGSLTEPVARVGKKYISQSNQVQPETSKQLASALASVP
jgi:hypothetical protein